MGLEGWLSKRRDRSCRAVDPDDVRNIEAVYFVLGMRERRA